MLTGIAVCLANHKVFGWLLRIGARFLSSDGIISVSVQNRLWFFGLYLGLVCLISGLYFAALRRDDFYRRIGLLLWKPRSPTGGPFLLKPGNLQFFSVSTGLFLTLFFSIFYSKKYEFLQIWFVEDGIFETASALAFLASAWFMGTAALLLRKPTGRLRIQWSKALAFIYVGLCGLFFVMGMEEISWGQRFFGWSTPDALRQVNAQNETSLHNIHNFSVVFEALYLLPALLWLPMVAHLFLRLLGKEHAFLAFLIPPSSLILLSFLIGAIALTLQGELLEELLALFIFLYAWELKNNIACASMRV